MPAHKNTIRICQLVLATTLLLCFFPFIHSKSIFLVFVVLRSQTKTTSIPAIKHNGLRLAKQRRGKNGRIKWKSPSTRSSHTTNFYFESVPSSFFASSPSQKKLPFNVHTWDHNARLTSGRNSKQQPLRCHSKWQISTQCHGNSTFKLLFYSAEYEYSCNWHAPQAIVAIKTIEFYGFFLIFTVLARFIHYWYHIQHTNGTSKSPGVCLKEMNPRICKQLL